MGYLDSSNEYRLKKRVNLWMSFASGLLVSNVILALLCWYAMVHQKIEITPFFGNQGYFKSDSLVDSHYLDFMAENFVLARLNITPGTIKARHAKLLSYVDSRYNHILSEVLLREQKQVLEKQISSYFAIETIQSSPKTLQTQISGTLRRFVGLRELAPIKASYILKFNYHLGRLAITLFEKKGENDV